MTKFGESIHTEHLLQLDRLQHLRCGDHDGTQAASDSRSSPASSASPAGERAAWPCERSVSDSAEGEVIGGASKEVIPE